jgi:Raf kinase inhibitor-like YbhB/YbcL family protein
MDTQRHYMEPKHPLKNRIGKGMYVFSRNIRSLFIAAVLPAFIACEPKIIEPDTEPVFTLTSPTLREGGVIPERHWYNRLGCSGGNVSPSLTWTGAPSGTQSFAITVHDEDGPVAGGFWHWMAYDIPAATSAIAEGSSPAGMPTGTVEAKNDLGEAGWFGACPTDGREHRYTYTVYALKTAKLDVPAGASTRFAGSVLQQNVLAKASLQVRAGVNTTVSAVLPTFRIYSPTLVLNGFLPQRHWFNRSGCTGDNVSPGFSWVGAPSGTKSYAITMFDLDAPTGSGLWHWLAYNIPADADSIAEGSSPGKMPEGTIEAGNDLGAAGWSGACPTDGLVHRYVFTVYALKTDSLPVPVDSNPAYIDFMILLNAIAKADLPVMAEGK